MADNNMADVRQEGQIDFTPEEGNDDPSSSPDGTNEADEAAAQAAAAAAAEEARIAALPFHEHPRWKERETEWENRFNTQEQRHQDDLKALREEFGAARKENAAQVQKPSWFGGTDEQWESYRADRDNELKSAEDRAIERLRAERATESKAVEEATAYMQSEIDFIQNDKALNPTGAKIDPNKLLAIVMDTANGGKYPMLDPQGRWNYRAAMRIYNATPAAQAKPADRKAIAGATTSEARGESKPAPFKTSADFKKSKPW